MRVAPPVESEAPQYGLYQAPFYSLVGGSFYTI